MLLLRPSCHAQTCVAAAQTARMSQLPGDRAEEDYDDNDSGTLLSTLQPILESDTALNSAVGGRPLLAYRQPPNLRHLLVSSKMSSNSRPTPNITVPCEVKRCKLCKHINSSQTIQGPNGNTVMVQGSHTCASSKLIYSITCTTCPDTIYIGKTGNTKQSQNRH